MLREALAVVVAWLVLPWLLALLVTVFFIMYAHPDSVVCELLRRSVANLVITCAVVALSTCMWSRLPRAIAILANVLLVLAALVNPAVAACLRRVDVRVSQAVNDEIVDSVKLLLLLNIHPPPRATSSRLVMLAFVRDEVIKAMLLASCIYGYRYVAGVDNTKSFSRLVGEMLIMSIVPPFLYTPSTRV